MSAETALYLRWINELLAGKPIAADIVSDDFVGHWPHRDAHGPEQLHAIVGIGATDSGPVRFTGNDILRVGDSRFAEYWVGTSTPS